MKYCAKCGKKVDDDVRFCPNCGADCESNEAAVRKDAAVLTKPENGDDQKLSWQRLVSKILLIISIVLAIIALVAFAIITIVYLIWAISATSATASLFSIFGLGGYVGGVLGGSVATYACFLFFILAYIIVAIVIISKTLKKIDKFKKMSTGLKVCVLIFANLLAGIFLLTESNNGYED